MAQPTSYLVSGHRRTDCPRDDEAGPWRWSPWAATRRCTTRPSRRARRPRRMTMAKSSARRRRWSAASTVSPDSRLRPRGGRDPWRVATRGWRDPHGCACAAGSRGSSRADGCSAGTCACSLSKPSVLSLDQRRNAPREQERSIARQRHQPTNRPVRDGVPNPTRVLGALAVFQTTSPAATSPGSRNRMAGRRLSGCGQRC